ncbi:MAG: TaqI-like C-terminal specificity domain-containing protein [Candidatus Aenigmatarchaeota archaeon]
MFTKEEAKQRVKELVEDFEKKMEYYSNPKTDEGNIETKLLEPLFYALGWAKDDFEKREKMQRKEGRGISDYAFKLNTRTVFFLEAKKVSINIDNDKATWKQAISYALSRSVPFAVLSNFKSLKIFCVEQESALNNQFRDLKYSEFITRFDDLWLLSRESFEKNMILDMAVREQRLKKRISINSELLEDFMQSRRLLVDNIEKNYPKKYEINEKDEIIQRLLDRLIFIRKAEDIGINRDKNSKDIELLKEIAALPESKIYTKLKEIFSRYNDTYNSGLFAKGLDSDVDSISLDGHIIKNLIEHLYESRNREYFYNFDWIDADILGQVYEQYLGKILQQKKSGISSLKGGQAHKKEQGIYYTPTYIVDYIVKNTIGELLKNKKADVEKLRVLDPACGSGSFLIKAFDRILDGYKNKHDVNQKKLDMQGAYSTKTDILKRNIFGVDLDSKAVEITKLNLLLKAAEAGRKLPSEIDSNIRTGNSLIDDPAADKNRFFKWDEKFPDIIQYDEKGILKEGYGFDVVIGNPPYLLMQPQNTPQELLDYVKNRFAVAQYKIDLYHLFFERAISLLKEGGCFGFITPNTYLMNIYINNLRKYILDNCKILQIIIIPREVFPDASVDTAITILQKESNKKRRMNNPVEVLEISNFIESAFKTATIPQSNFFEAENHVFNVNLAKKDIVFFKKFEHDTFTKLGNIAHPYFGIQTFDRKKYVSETKVDSSYKPVIDGQDISRYRLSNRREFVKFTEDAIKSGGKQNVYENEKIFVRQIGKYPIATYGPAGVYSLNTVYNIFSKDAQFNLKYILAILNSKLMAYFWKLNFSDSKELFPKIKRNYLEAIPIKIISKSEQQPIITLVDKIIALNARLTEFGSKKTEQSSQISEEITRIDAEIDEFVYKIYGITEEEKKIIENSLK